MIELTKGQKKTCRLLIDRALQRECGNFLNATKTLLQKMNQNEKSPHDNYLDLFKEVYSFDKHIARCYDNMTGARYLLTILNLYGTDMLTDEDISLFDEEMQERIRQWKKVFRR